MSITRTNLNITPLFSKYHFSNYFLILSALVLSIILISSLSAQSYALNTMFPDYPPKKTSMTHVYKKHGFQFDLPKGWKITQSASDTLVFSHADKSRTMLMVSRGDLPEGGAIEYFPLDSKSKRKEFEIFITEDPPDFGGFKFKNFKFTYYDDGVKITASMSARETVDGKSVSFKGNMISWLSPESEEAYIIMFVSENYKTHSKAFEIAAKSFYPL